MEGLNSILLDNLYAMKELMTQMEDTNKVLVKAVTEMSEYILHMEERLEKLEKRGVFLNMN